MTSAPPTSAALWRATRAYSFPASVIPVLLGTALAVRGYAYPAMPILTPSPLS